MPPGMTICPLASTVRAALIEARVPGAPIAAILPPLIPISAASVDAGITAVPPEMIRSNICPSRQGLRERSTPRSAAQGQDDTGHDQHDGDGDIGGDRAPENQGRQHKT